MKNEIISEKYGVITYEESFWSGKKIITINGAALQKMSKNEYILEEEERRILVRVKGNYLSGAKLIIDDEEILVSPKILWYEWLLSVIPFVLVLTWGNSEKAVKIFPIIGGAIGGAIAGCFLAVSIVLMKMTKKPLFKVLIGLASCVVTILLLYLAAKIYISMVA